MDDEREDDGEDLVVPTVDADGVAIPEWKRKVLEERVEKKKTKRAVKQQKVGEYAIHRW